jgi:hypothetical protein
LPYQAGVKNVARTIAMVGTALVASRLEASGSAGTAGGFHLVAQTVNFSFYTRDGRKPDARRCQRFLTETAENLGAPVQGRSDYFLYRQPEEIAVSAGQRVVGFTERAGQIHSLNEFHAHEIVHRVTFLLGDPGRFFNEGIAVAMGDQGRWHGRPVDELARRILATRSFRTLLEHFETLEPEATYPAAGSFVGWLIRGHGGLPRFSQFLKACGKAGFPREIKFREVYGMGLDEAAEAWATSLGPAAMVGETR